MNIFDQLLDELAGDIKEAPGWLTLVLACNLLVLVPSVVRGAGVLGIEFGAEKGFFATLAAILIFCVGDSLDSIVFPRKKDGQMWPKLLRSLMRALAALAFFFAIHWELVRAGIICGVFALLIAFHYRLRAAEEPESEASEQKKTERTGFDFLAPTDLDRARQTAEEKLGVRTGVYSVSKALVKAAGMYDCSWIQAENESAKFFRSWVIPMLVWAGVGASQSRWSWVALAILTSLALLMLYGRLKGHHMRRLYRIVAENIVRERAFYATSDFEVKVETDVKKGPENRKLRVFCWNGKIVASGKTVKSK